MERTTITQTLPNGMRNRYTISKYLINEDARNIQVFYRKELLAPLTDDIVTSEEKSYSLDSEFFNQYESATFQQYITAGVNDLQAMFRGRALAKISQIENITKP
jgi:hypothetical protein